MQPFIYDGLPCRVIFGTGTLANLAGAALGIDLPDWQDALERCLWRREGQAATR